MGVAGHILDLLQLWRPKLGDETYSSLEKQLIGLLADEDELNRYNVRPSNGSFIGLARFIETHPDVSHPGLALREGGLFEASWSPAALTRLTLVFETASLARWIAVSPAERARGEFSPADP